LGEIDIISERPSMKKSILPALLLTFMTTIYGAYGSSVSESEEFQNENFPSKLKSNFLASMKSDSENAQEYLQEGRLFLSSGNISSAYQSFLNAIEYGAGSPLGYLYAGALTGHVPTSERYLRIAQLAVQQGALSEETFDEHVNYLTQTGFLMAS